MSDRCVCRHASYQHNKGKCTICACDAFCAERLGAENAANNMVYKYSEERKSTFTERGQIVLLAIRDAAFNLIDLSGVALSGNIMDAAIKKLGAGDTWEMFACLDRLVEIKELVEVTDPQLVAGQDRIFARRWSY